MTAASDPQPSDGAETWASSAEAEPGDAAVNESTEGREPQTADSDTGNAEERSNDIEGTVEPDPTPEDQLDEAVQVLLKLQAERDEYLDLAQRERADHENSKRRWERERVQTIERAEARLAKELLSVLDACDGAVAHGSDDVAAVQTQLVNVLTGAGLSRIDDVDVEFDPTIHEAVLTEAGEGEPNQVTKVLRPGYLWRGNLLRAAMVQVRG